MELSVYEPHPFTAGELAEEQRGGYFSFIRGAGVEGHKLGGESVIVTVPMKSKGMNEQNFCKACREWLTGYANQGYVVADLKDPEAPIIYKIYANASFSFRCYDISIQEQKDAEKFEITIVGTLN